MPDFQGENEPSHGAHSWWFPGAESGTPQDVTLRSHQVKLPPHSVDSLLNSTPW
jgi:hypothetical protein